jgi:hypothetical protein
MQCRYINSKVTPYTSYRQADSCNLIKDIFENNDYISELYRSFIVSIRGATFPAWQKRLT